MPDTIEPSVALAPVIASLDAVQGAARADGVARLRKIQARIRQLVKARQDEFHGAYRATLASEVTPEALETAAEALKKKQLAERELLTPHIEQAKEKLRLRFPSDTEVQELVNGTADAAAEFISLYDWLRDAALKLAAERRTGMNARPHARPIEGEIDHVAVTQEIIARYPKILAALAK